MSGDRHFNADKVFLLLFCATALEVGWGILFGPVLQAAKVVLWGGLIVFAFYKGLLIASYFMHLKFEGWVIWSLLLPTPFLMIVIFGYVLNDVANTGPTDNLVHPIGAMVDKTSGKVRDDMWWRPEEEHAARTEPAADSATTGGESEH